MSPAPRRVAYLLDRFPVRSETFVTNEIAALREAGTEVLVEAAARGDVESADPAVRYAADDGRARRLADLAWLLATRPRACLQDLRARRRWAREEWPRPLRHLAPVARRLDRAAPEHLHAHFAAGAALDALRLARLLGVRYGVTAHAYDIFLSPRNLAEKLESAAVPVTVCAYNARHLREVAPRAPLRTMVMGVDGRGFARTTPRPHGRTVVAVGRLVEKKGFADLVEAAARLAADRPLDRVLIVGDGPLRAELEGLAARRGVADTVRFLGPRDPAGVRAVLEEADLLAMPCVVAADGDRDAMPVVVKEALAMEVPVVGTREVAMPEMVEDGWGRLVAPHDPDALAEALDAVLALPPEERAAMGAAGRAFVLEHCDVCRETARLAGWMAEAAASPTSTVSGAECRDFRGLRWS
jgi:glycosyltransferase involved in cell wall biosynthesis